MIDIGGDMVWWLILGVAASLFFAGLRAWAPKAGARRVAERGSIVGPPLKPTFEQQAIGRGPADMQRLANRKLHDDMLADALTLKLRARTGSVEERIETIDRAISKVEDALTARPGSYEGTKLLGEVYLDRALLMEGVDAVAPLERAAQLFAEASSYRLGVIDNYVGRGWAYLQMTRVDPDYAHVYAEKAVAALAAGFERVQQNVWVLRGWAVAVDRYARSPMADAGKLAEFESAYRAALERHRGGQHDLFEWYAQVRSATEPTWVEVPPLRDVY